MARDLASTVLDALVQPTVRPRVLLDLQTVAGSTYYFATDSMTWKGQTYAARLPDKQPPVPTFSPSAPERGILGSSTLRVTIPDDVAATDPDGRLATFPPGTFENQPLDYKLVLADVDSHAVLDLRFTVTHVQAPQLGQITLTAADPLSAVRHKNWPQDPWLLTPELIGSAPNPQGAYGPNRVTPLRVGQCISPAIVEYDFGITHADSEPSGVASGHHSVLAGFFAKATADGENRFVQLWDDGFSTRYSLVQSVDTNLSLTINGEKMARYQIHAGTPLSRGGTVVPLFFAGRSTTPGNTTTGRRHSWLPAETLEQLIDHGEPFSVEIGMHDPSRLLADLLYQGPANDLGNDPLSNVPTLGFNGFVAEQRPLDQWVGDLMHDGCLGLRLRDEMHVLALPFSRAVVGSFHEGNIIRGTLSWQDTPLEDLETTRTIFYRRQALDVEPNHSETWSAAADGGSVSRTSHFLGHNQVAHRVAQFWAKREAFGRRTYQWQSTLLAAGLEQYDLVQLHVPTMGASGQLCEITNLGINPDFTTTLTARTTSWSVFDYTDTPTLNWAPEIRFAQRVPFPHDSWHLSGSGDTFTVNHELTNPPTVAVPHYVQPTRNRISYPSSLISATDSDATIFVDNVSFASGYDQFELILFGWDLLFDA